LDGLLANHFPVALDKSLPPIAASQFPVAVLIEQSIAAWMNSLVFEKTQPLSSWFLRLQKWLAELPVYKIHEVTPDSKRDRTQTAYAILMQLLQRLAKMNERLDTYGTIVEAIEVLLDRIRETRVRQPEGPNQIEILGWLDLALDDAPALIVVGLNHPFVPQAVTNDPFLPGGLRTRLGVMDNDRRLTRDVYALHLMLRSRTFKRFIFGKYSADGSPTPPSRLLAMTSPEDCARHVRTVLDSRRVTTTLKHPWDEIRRDAPLKRPPVDPAKRVASLSVTSLKDYLACPYRFYLRHVENLKPIDDSESELAANQFGDLIHMCMELFGLSPQKNETSAKRIEEQLIEHLSTHTSKFFGPATSRAVTLQIEQAKRRLAMVAVRQAEWVAEGWHIHQVEATVSDTLGAKITVDDQSIGLRGRLDRIDYHPATGRWTILDYKTHGHTPETQHLKRRGNGRFEWIDLQLPLYRRMIPFLGLDVDPNDVQLGYFNISGKEEETKINIAEFTPDQLAEADNLIIECARRILAGNFEPNPEGVQYDDYPMIVVSK
jgi:RecB family exonuclease